MSQGGFEGEVSDGTQRSAVALVGTSQGLGNVVVLDDGRLGPEVRAATRLSREESIDAVVTMGATMQPIVRRIGNAARSPSPLLLVGEVGSGKGAIARLVHELSPRADMPFVRLDCAAISTSEFEAELVGFKRIAVTGATRDRDGLLLAANKGTLLLENVDAIAMSLHPRLEEILSSGEVCRLGDRWNPRQIDVRVIATTGNADTLKDIPGSQRSALYDRLSVLSFEVPSLRDRAQDVVPLLKHFGRISTAGVGVEIEDAALALLETYSWPGNIRELQNAVECGVVLGDGKCIRVSDLPVVIQQFAKAKRGQDESEQVLEVVETPGSEDELIEPRCIVEAMKKTGADRNAVARLLGMTRRTLAYRIALYGLDVDLGELEDAASKRGGVRTLAKVRPAARHLHSLTS